MSDKFGSAIILSGPSGVGKSTVINEVRKRVADLAFSVSCTTRAPRPGEEDGREYYFLTDDEFSEHLRRGDFLEHAGVFGKRYGTLRSEIEDRCRAGMDVVLDIDVQGAMQIREQALKSLELGRYAEFVFIVPPSLGELERRLRGRNTESEEQIGLRLGKAAHELSFWREYDYLIVNDDVERAAADLLGLLRSFSLKSARINRELFER